MMRRIERDLDLQESRLGAGRKKRPRPIRLRAGDTHNADSGPGIGARREGAGEGPNGPGFADAGAF